VLVEPVSGSPTYPLKTADDAVAVVDRVRVQTGVTNLGLLCDLYHLSANGDDLDWAVDRYAGQVAHVQIADSPGRGEPGTGSLDLDRYLSALANGGYRGWVGLEYKTTSTTTEQGLDAWLPRDRRGAGTLTEPSREQT